jgi:hypothetical protein
MIYVEDQSIKVNGVVLPGVIKSIEVTSAATIDEQQVEGSSAKPKQATGYADAKIQIELILDDTPTQTKYERLEVVRALFRKPGQAVPQPIPIVCEDTAAHGVEQVLFKGLSHKVDNKKHQIPVSLEFWEYVPQTIQTTKSTSTSKKRKKSNYSKKLKTSPKIQRSPAIDMPSSSTILKSVLDMPFYMKG